MDQEDEKRENVRQQLLALEMMTKEELIEKWKDLFGRTPPEYGRVFMRRRLAHRIQEIHYGGLNEQLKKRILAEGDPLKSRRKKVVKCGMQIMKIWKKSTYLVKILPDGYEYNGMKYKSLSKIASEITGTHWNGNKFFNIG